MKRKMEVKDASDVELSRSEKRRALSSKRKKKSMIEQEIQSGNAVSEEEKGTCLEAEQSSPPRKKRKRKMKMNSSIDEKKTDSFLKEEANSLTNTLSETDSNVRTLENTGSEPGPNEEPACSETKRKKKKKKAESVLELKDTQGNPLIDENKVSDSNLKGSNNLEILDNLPGLEGAQLNESETKMKKKKKKRDKTKLGAIEDEDISSKSNVKDDNEAGNKNMCAETQIIDGKEDLISISEAVESKNTKKVSEEAFGCSTVAESDLKGRKRKKRKKSKEKDIEIETETEQVIPSPFPGNGISYPKKKLLILDLNGILVDVVQSWGNLIPHARVSGKGVFKRPFCDDFLAFCFSTFKVGIWSSRVEKNVNSVLDFLMGEEWKRKLLFCWNRDMCTITKFKTLESKDKPLVLKELKIIWDKRVPGLPWKKGKYDESNTLLLDDSPYKALRNPPNTAIFPYPYQYTDAEDCSLASGGDIRKYLERLAAAENVQKFVEQNPFGQPAITEADPHWDFYSQIQKIGFTSSVTGTECKRNGEKNSL